jgi:hypothetical protein
MKIAETDTNVKEVLVSKLKNLLSEAEEIKASKKPKGVVLSKNTQKSLVKVEKLLEGARNLASSPSPEQAVALYNQALTELRSALDRMHFFSSTSYLFLLSNRRFCMFV